MKKTKLILGVVAAMVLAACGGKTGPSASSSAITESAGSGDASSAESIIESSKIDSGSDASSVFDTSVESGDESHEGPAYDSSEEGSHEAESGEDTSQEPPVTDDWTDEQKDLMSEHLHGEILPYLGMSVEVEYSAEADIVYMLGGRLGGPEKLEAISTLFTLADGWIGGENSAAYDAEEGSLYTFVKEVSTEAGARFVAVNLYGWDFDNEDYDAYGYFVLEAYDPYMYEFPTLAAAAFAAEYDSEIVPPAIEADYYSVNADYQAIVAFLDSEEEDAGYTAILLESGNFIPADGKDSAGLFVAAAIDGSYELHYGYFAALGALYIQLMPSSVFPAAKVAEFLSANPAFEGFEYPAQDFEGAYYFFDSEDSDYGPRAFVLAYNVEESDLEAYLGSLEDDGYAISHYVSSDYDVYVAEITIPEQGVFAIYLSYYEDYGVIQSMFYLELDPLPSTEWPEEDVAYIEYLLGAEEDTIPVADTEGAVNVFIDTYYEIVVEYATEDEATAAYADYIAVLGDAGFAEYGEDDYGDMQYISSNGEFLLTPYVYENYFVISPATVPSTEWPAETVAYIEYLLDADQDSIPEADTEGAVEVFVDDYYEIVIEYATDAEAAAALAAYAVVLGEAGFEEFGVDSYGDMQYISPNGEFLLIPYVEDNYFVIAPSTVPSTEWPADYVAYIEYLLGAEQDYIPEADTEGALDVYVDSYYQVVSQYASGTDATVALVAYTVVLRQAGFTQYGEDSYGDMQWLSPNGEFLIIPYVSGNYFVISFANVPSTDWPADDVAALLAYYGAEEDTLPVADTSEAVNVYVNGSNIVIQCADEEASADALEAYTALVLGAEFTELGVDGDGDMQYASPNEEFAITLFTSGAYFAIYVSSIPEPPEPASWPTDDVNAAIADYADQDSVPEYVPENARDIYYDSYYASVIFEFSTGAEAEAALEEYVGILGEADYTEAGLDGEFVIYHSANEEIIVEPYVTGTYLVLYIAMVPSDEWPAETVASWLSEAVTDVLPALEDDAVTGYSVDGQIVWVDVDSEASATAIGEAYVEALVAEGWVLDETKSEAGDYYLTSPNNQISINVYCNENGAYIGVIVSEIISYPVALDVDEVNAFFAEYAAADETVHGPMLLEAANAISATIDEEPYLYTWGSWIFDADYTFSFSFETEDEAQAYVADYNAAIDYTEAFEVELTEDGFVAYNDYETITVTVTENVVTINYVYSF